MAMTKKSLASAGWVLAHEQEAVVELDRTGSKATPGSFRAERFYNGVMINLAAETMDGLLAVVEEWEKDPIRTAVEAANAPPAPAQQPAATSTGDVAA